MYTLSYGIIPLRFSGTKKAPDTETGSTLQTYNAGDVFFGGAASSTTIVFRGIRSLLIAAS